MTSTSVAVQLLQLIFQPAHREMISLVSFFSFLPSNVENGAIARLYAQLRPFNPTADHHLHSQATEPYGPPTYHGNRNMCLGILISKKKCLISHIRGRCNSKYRLPLNQSLKSNPGRDDRIKIVRLNIYIADDRRTRRRRILHLFFPLTPLSSKKTA